MGGHHQSTDASKTSIDYQHSTTDQSTTYNNQWGENNVRGGNVGAGVTIGLQNLKLAEIPSFASLHPTTHASPATHTPSRHSMGPIAQIPSYGSLHPSTHTAPAYHAPSTHAPATHAPVSYNHHAQTVISGINALSGAGQVASGLWGNYNTMKSNDLQAQQMAQMRQMQAQMQAMQQAGMQVPHAIVMLIWWPQNYRI